MPLLDLRNEIFVRTTLLSSHPGIENSKSNGCLESCDLRISFEQIQAELNVTVTDFAAIPLQLLDLLVLLDVLLRLVFVVDFWPTVLVVFLELAKEILPYLLSRLVVEALVANRYVDARHERFVKVAHAVGGQKQNALKVVHRAQKDCSEGLFVSSFFL